MFVCEIPMWGDGLSSCCNRCGAPRGRETLRVGAGESLCPWRKIYYFPRLGYLERTIRKEIRSPAATYSREAYPQRSCTLYVLRACGLMIANQPKLGKTV